MEKSSVGDEAALGVEIRVPVDRVVPGQLAAQRSGGWSARYRRCLVITDVVIIFGVVMISQILRFQYPTQAKVGGTGGWGYSAISLTLAGCWIVALALHGAWDAKSLGAGPTEFRRVTVASCAVISCTAIFSFLTRTEIARGYLAFAFPLGVFGLLGGRWVWRRLLIEHRRAGNYLNSVLVIGGGVSALALANRLHHHFEAGYRVAGLCIPGGARPSAASPPATVDGFAVLGGIGDVDEVIVTSGVDTVAVAATEVFSPQQIRRLAWQLEGSNVQLILAPALTDVAGPRIHVEPVAGLPLMDVRAPTFAGPKLAAKVILDYLVAAVGLTLLLPVFLITALAIAIGSGRPLFYRPLRVGRGGRLFRLFRFRSMTVDGDRVSSVGRVIRRLGIDQSAQLMNVIAGHMSIVGARPIEPDEIIDAETHLERRLRLRPGITGPSQVLDSHHLQIADQVQLDLHYIENWSISGDLLLMSRAAQVLFRRRWTDRPADSQLGQ